MAKANPIDLELMRQTFCYPSPMGKLYWLKTLGNRAIVLDEAGSLHPEGYFRVRVKGIDYPVHRIVYAMRHDIKLSVDIQIDHVNGNKSDNRITNLRIATNSENQRNQGTKTNSTSEFKGVHLRTGCIRWIAQISHNGEKIYLGSHCTPEQAAIAYNEAAKRLHGEYARLNAIPETPRLGRPLGEQLTLFDSPKENAQKNRGGQLGVFSNA